MGNFTFDEMNLMCIYNTGTREGLINALKEMRGFWNRMRQSFLPLRIPHWESSHK